jgi:hypothetical protein
MLGSRDLDQRVAVSQHTEGHHADGDLNLILAIL